MIPTGKLWLELWQYCVWVLYEYQHCSTTTGGQRQLKIKFWIFSSPPFTSLSSPWVRDNNASIYLRHPRKKYGEWIEALKTMSQFVGSLYWRPAYHWVQVHALEWSNTPPKVRLPKKIETGWQKLCYDIYHTSRVDREDTQVLSQVSLENTRQKINPLYPWTKKRRGRTLIEISKSIPCHYVGHQHATVN